MFRKAMISLGCIVIAQGAFAAPSVVEAWQEIHNQGVAGELLYELRQEGGRWVTTSPDWGTPMPVTVDGTNGFVEIVDEGTGGGSLRTQVVLWRMADGQPLVGLGETSYSPPYPDTTRVRFFGHEDGHGWADWSDYVWPDPDIADFMTDDMSVGDLRALEAIGVQVAVSLPQHGTSPVAQLITRDTEISAVCGGEDWFVPSDPAPYLRYCDQLSGQLFREIEVIWNKDEYQFEMGARSR